MSEFRDKHCICTMGFGITPGCTIHDTKQETAVRDAIELIADERKRQIEVEGWTPDHDDEHDDEQMAAAAAYYASPEKIFVHRKAESPFFSGNTGDRGDRQLRKAGYYEAWPWDDKWNKKSKHDRLRQLTIVGALIVAEIDRIQRGKTK